VGRLRRPVRGQPQKPVLTGRALWRAGTYTAPVIAPFTIGALTAADKPGATLTTATTAAGTLTGADSGYAGGYPGTYQPTYGTAAAGKLTAGDTRTGGPG